MSLYVQKDFAALCGISKAMLSMNKSRGKVVLNRDGFIDDEHQVNVAFKKKWQEKNADKVDLTVKPYVKPKPVKKPKPKPRVEQDKAPEPESPRFDEMDLSNLMDSPLEGLTVLQLDKVEQIDKIKKLREDITYRQNQNSKIEGENIPVPAVELVISQLFKSSGMAFKNVIDNLILQISQEHKFSNAVQSKYKGLAIQLLNKGIKTYVRDSKKAIDSIVDEYSIKRGVGERK